MRQFRTLSRPRGVSGRTLVLMLVLAMVGLLSVPAHRITAGGDPTTFMPMILGSGQGGSPGGGNFAYQLIDDQILHGQGLTIADIDADGDEDVIVSLSLTDAVYLYVNGGNSSGGGNGSSWATVQVGADNTIVSMQTAVADFDDDNDLDIAAVGLFDRSCGFCSAGEVVWYENPGNVLGTWTEHSIAPSLWGARYIDTTDITGDGLPDLVLATIEINGQGNGLYWFRNVNDASSWAGPTAIDAGLMRVEIAIAHDVDNDTVMDIIAVGADSNEINWYENTRTGVNNNPTFVQHPIATPADPYNISLANMDGDPALEMFTTSDLGLIWYDPPANPANPWSASTVDATFGTEFETVFAADFDNDNDVDVAIASGSSGLLGWYQNGGGGGWTWQTILAYGGLNVVTGGDLNNDNRTDLVTSTYDQQPGVSDEIVWWLNQP